MLRLSSTIARRGGALHLHNYNYHHTSCAAAAAGTQRVVAGSCSSSSSMLLHADTRACTSASSMTATTYRFKSSTAAEEDFAPPPPQPARPSAGGAAGRAESAGPGSGAGNASGGSSSARPVYRDGVAGRNSASGGDNNKNNRRYDNSRNSGGRNRNNNSGYGGNNRGQHQRHGHNNENRRRFDNQRNSDNYSGGSGGYRGGRRQQGRYDDRGGGHQGGHGNNNWRNNNNSNNNNNRNEIDQGRSQYSNAETSRADTTGGALRSRLDKFRASSQAFRSPSSPAAASAVRQVQQPTSGSNANTGTGSWRRTRLGSGGGPSASSPPATTTTSSPRIADALSPSPTSTLTDSSPAGDNGASKVTKLRDAFMKQLMRDRERKREQQQKQQKQQRDGAMQRQQQGQQGQQQGQRKPSWRDRGLIRERRTGGGSGPGSTFQQQYQQQQDGQPTESESDKILRQMEEARQEAIKSAKSSDKVKKAAAEAASQANDDDTAEDNDNTIILPHRSLTLSELSSLLRVRISKLRDTVSSLGEHVPHDDSNAAEHRIDIDVAELATLELGFDPVRAKHGAGHKWKSLEEAEKRMRRGVGSTDAVAAADEGVDVKTVEDMEYESLPPRPPVVCIMGHVDHGKTTLMDALRRRAEASGLAGNKKKGKAGGKKKKAKNKSSTNVKEGKGGAIVGDVAGSEAGGITQVITAFQVSLPSAEDSSDSDMDAAVTFLDTPGHAAFKSMRRSGSSGADIIVLVVAADDGVSPQTIEILDTYKSIAQAQPGSISLVVAMTKIDKPGIDIDESRMMIENQLLEQGILTEGMSSGEEESEFGPPAQLIPVSGMTGEGLDDLIEGLVLQSEVMDLRADEEARAEGVVMDARVDKGLGVVADCIVRWGKLERGDYVVSGVHGGKIKVLSDVSGGALKRARPSQPVRLVGFKTLPKAGDPIVSVQSEEIAKELISRREAIASTDGTATAFRADSTACPELQVTGMASKQGAMLKRVLERYGMDGEDTDETIRIPVIIKADADGSLEAVRDSMLAIGGESKLDIIIDPISMGVGPPTTTDVTLAKESGASVFCFAVKGTADKAAASLAESEGVSIMSNDVIYTLLDEAKELFASHLPPVAVEKVHGSAEVKAVYDINNKKDAERIAGLQVTEGQLFLDKTTSDEGTTLTCHYRILRGGELVSDDSKMLRAKSLRKQKEEVSDVRRGEECGLGLGFEDLQEGDHIECYSVQMKKEFV